MLQHLMERECTLLDYEKICDPAGRRLVFFGLYAGIAGMIDTLWALGQRFSAEGFDTPLASLKNGMAYASIDEALDAIEEAGRKLQTFALPDSATPLVIGVTGSGNAARGAMRVLDRLGARAIQPAHVDQPPSGAGIYSVNFSHSDIAERRLGLPSSKGFDKADYYERPGRYRGIFERYLPYLNVLANCIYWDDRYPRLVTLEGLRQLYDDPRQPRLRVIGDITCDVRGAIEATIRTTTPEVPTFLYDVETGEDRDGFEGHGPVIVAVYNLPTEFPAEASTAFGNALMPFIEPLASCDYDRPFESLALPVELTRAIIVHRGELTPAYKYIQKYI